MKKACPEKPVEGRNHKKEFSKIRFELSRTALDPFISKKTESMVIKTGKIKNFKEEDEKCEDSDARKLGLQLSRGKAVSLIEPSCNSFNNRLLLLQYGKEEVYTDSIRT